MPVHSKIDPPWTHAPVIALLLATFLSAPAAATDTSSSLATIRLTITNVDPGKGGNVDILLYDRHGWLHADQAIRQQELAIEGHRQLELDMKALAYPETYALEVFQDSNHNHALDMRWFPFPGPAEAYGFSNDYVPVTKPSFAKSSFLLQQKVVSIRIRLHD